MATWIPKITVLDISTRRIAITVTRTEVNESDRSYTISTFYDTTLTKDNNLIKWCNDLWAIYQAELTKESTIAVLISDMEALLTTKLNSKETG